MVEGGSGEEIGGGIYCGKSGGVGSEGRRSVSIYESKGYGDEVNFSGGEDGRIYVSGRLKGGGG